ncbi:TPA: superoxide dismutase [Fe] [Candidatus Uhrbacteria bacterium]|nr:superoxide dismutase [Fe] [Candidatus Uhrbacteria bacterium]
MPFSLPNLPFASDVFGTFLSEKTFLFHHGKHHAGYVDKLNAAVEGTPYADMELDALIQASREAGAIAIFNHAAQHFNHSFFWNSLSPQTQVVGAKTQKAFERDFGSFDVLRSQFSDAAIKLFGSGWVWLVKNADGTLAIQTGKDAETPAGTQKTALLTLDVWEHAYYLDYQNDRAGYIELFWEHVNWKFVEDQMS